MDKSYLALADRSVKVVQALWISMKSHPLGFEEAASQFGRRVIDAEDLVECFC